jgi:DNA-binding NtrC family response regulator
MVVLSDSPIIDVTDLPEKVLTGATVISSAIPQLDLPETGIDLSTAVNEFERSIIVQALNKSNWVKNRAAKLLHVNRTTLVEKIKKQKLQKPTESNIS